MPKLVAMLRVKDGILFVERWLDTIGRLADEIVVVDNGSTDGTLEILRRHPKVVAIRQTEGFHEGRDKILAYSLLRARKPDWGLYLDVDEWFEDRVTREVLDRLMASKRVNRYLFRLFTLHRDERHFEAGWKNLWKTAVPIRSLWREHPSGHFSGARIHSAGIMGIPGPRRLTHLRLKHYGSLNRDYLTRKTAQYIALDPEQRDMYIAHRDQVLPVWRWYEHHERPALVTAQNLFLDTLCYAQMPGILWARLRARLKPRAGARAEADALENDGG